MNTLRFVLALALAAAHAVAAEQDATHGPLRIRVDTRAPLAHADLDSLRGVCCWQLYGDADHPTRKAWDRAAFRHARGIHLSCVDATWASEVSGRRLLDLHFEGLDAALAAASRMKAEPLFMFAGMPAAIAAQPPGNETAGKEHPAQFGLADFRCWDEYVNRVIEHLVQRGHRGACYEVWNEPEDYHESRSKTPGTDTLPDYLALYLHTARAIKAVDRTAKVGGPVCAT